LKISSLGDFEFFGHLDISGDDSGKSHAQASRPIELGAALDL